VVSVAGAELAAAAVEEEEDTAVVVGVGATLADVDAGADADVGGAEMAVLRAAVGVGGADVVAVPPLLGV
jgi:hypothetical protein